MNIMNKYFYILSLVATLLVGCGEAPEPDSPVGTTTTVTTVTQLTQSLSPAPVTGTLILAQTTEPRPTGIGTIPVLKAINETEFDTNKVSKNYIFVGRVPASAVAGAYQLRGIYDNGTKHYFLYSPFAVPPPTSELVGYGYQSKINNSVSMLCEFPFGFAMCALFPNQRGQAIGFIYYTTDEDVSLGRNQ